MNLTCPHCGGIVELSLIKSNTPNIEGDDNGRLTDPNPATENGSKVGPYHFRIWDIQLELTIQDVRSALPNVHQAIRDSYLEVTDMHGEVFKVSTKDAIRQAILLKYPHDDQLRAIVHMSNGFQTDRAERIARGVGLTPKRRGAY